MPLDTRLPLLAGQFQPISLQQPSRANMLAEVAQAASAMQGLQRNAMAMRDAEQERTAMTGVADMINKAKGQGMSPSMLREMAGALGGMPRFVNESVKLLQAADVMEREQQQRETDEREYARIFSGAAPAGVSAPAAPAAMVAQPAAAPSVVEVPAVPNAMAQIAPSVNVLAQGPKESDMIQGGAAGTATTSAVGRGVGAPMLTQFMPPMPSRTEYDEATARIDAMRRSISMQMARAQDPGLTEQERLQAREIATLQSTELQKAQQTIGNYLANMGEADLPGGLIEPTQVPVRLQLPPEAATAAAPQPEPAPVVAPRATAPAGVQVAGPMVAGAAPAAGEDEIAALESQRERVRTSRLSAARKKDELAEIDRKLGILREKPKTTAGSEFNQLLNERDRLVAAGQTGTERFNLVQQRLNRLTGEDKGVTVEVQVPVWNPVTQQMEFASRERIAQGGLQPPSARPEPPTLNEQQASTATRRLLQRATEISDVVSRNRSAEAPGVGEALVENIPFISRATNLVRSQDRQVVASAQADVLDALLYLATGAAYNKEQLEQQKLAYLASWSDTKEVRSLKRQRLVQMIDNAKVRAGRAWSPELDAAMQKLLESPAMRPAGQPTAPTAPAAAQGAPAAPRAPAAPAAPPAQGNRREIAPGVFVTERP